MDLRRLLQQRRGLRSTRRHTLEKLTYCCNEDQNPELDGIDPARVPHAIEIRFNPQATRGRDWREIPQGSEVTLVVGDSFCFGQGVREQDRFGDRIERKLNADDGGRRHVLLAACFAGADVNQAARALENFGGRLPGLRRVIYAYTLNDPIMDDTLKKKQKYINDFMHLRVRGKNYNLPEPDRASTPMLEWFRSQSVKRGIARETIQWYHDLHSGPTWQETQNVILGMNRFAREKNARMTLVVFPLFHRFDDYPFRDIHAKIVAFATRNGLAVIDLMEAFEGTIAEDFWVHPKDFHPNHVAHAITANFLLERMDW